MLIKTNKTSPLKGLFNSIFKMKMLTPLLIYFIWFSMGVLLLNYINVWELNYFKMTILWFVIEAVLILFNTITLKDSKQVKQLFIIYLKQATSLSVLITLFFNLYTFNYFIELLLTFTLILLGIVVGGLQAANTKSTNRILNVIYIITSVVLLTYISIRLFLNFDFNMLLSILREYIIMIIYTIWVIPIVYIFKLITVYEVVWIDIKRIKYLTKRIKNRILLSTFINCHFNLRKLEYFKNDRKWKSMKFNTIKEIKEYFSEFNIAYKNSIK